MNRVYRNDNGELIIDRLTYKLLECIRYDLDFFYMPPAVRVPQEFYVSMSPAKKGKKGLCRAFGTKYLASTFAKEYARKTMKGLPDNWWRIRQEWMRTR